MLNLMPFEKRALEPRKKLCGRSNSLEMEIGWGEEEMRTKAGNSEEMEGKYARGRES